MIQSKLFCKGAFIFFFYITIQYITKQIKETKNNKIIQFFFSNYKIFPTQTSQCGNVKMGQLLDKYSS